MLVVENYCNVFEDQFKKTINTLSPNKEKIDVERFTSLFGKNFDYELNKAKNLHLITEKSLIDTVNVSLQPYLDEISLRIQELEMDIDLEESILVMDDIITGFVEEVKIIPVITDSEKQLIVENILLRKDIFLTVLKYSEYFDSESQELIKCGWFCKKRKQIACLSYTIFTSGMCGLSVAAIIKQQYEAAFVAGSFCSVLIYNSIQCWKNI